MTIRPGSRLAALAVGIPILLTTACATDVAALRDEDVVPAAVVEQELVAWSDVGEGDCLARPHEDPKPEYIDLGIPVPKVSCDDPHSDEVFAAFDVEGFDAYPGYAALAEHVDDACRERYDAFLALPVEYSEYSFWGIYPGEDLWAEGFRRAQCVAIASDGASLTGSLEGVGR